jgi:hypothetical protein
VSLILNNNANPRPCPQHWDSSSYLLLCTYAELSAQPDHSSYGSIFYPTCRNRYKLNIGAPRPVGVRFHLVLERLVVHLPRMNPSRLSFSTLIYHASDLWFYVCLVHERRKVSPYSLIILRWTPFRVSRIHSSLYRRAVCSRFSGCAFVYEDNFCPTASIVLIACMRTNFRPLIEFFFSFDVNIGGIISSADSFSALHSHRTIRRFHDRCPISVRQGSLLYFVEYLATRLQGNEVQPLKKPLCSDM